MPKIYLKLEEDGESICRIEIDLARLHGRAEQDVHQMLTTIYHSFPASHTLNNDERQRLMAYLQNPSPANEHTVRVLHKDRVATSCVITGDDCEQFFAWKDTRNKDIDTEVQRKSGALLSEMQKAAQAIQAQLNQKLRDIDSLTKQLKQKEAELTRLGVQLAEKDQKISNLKGQVEDLQANNRHLVDSLTQAQTDLDTCRQSLSHNPDIIDPPPPPPPPPFKLPF